MTAALTGQQAKAHAVPEPGEIPTMNPSGGTIVSGGRGWHRE
jgi:hypothetical protein